MRNLAEKLRRYGDAALYVSVAVIYAVVEWAPNFKDPDSFYHVRMARFIASGTLLKDFRWLPFTTLSRAYADQHFLYHVLLAPFVAVSPFIGAKVATVLFAAAAVAVVHRLLQHQGVRHAWVYAILLAVTPGFLFRINLTKATAVALVLLIAAFWAALSRRPWLLAVIGFVHVWTHGSWPASIVAVAVVVGARAMVEGGTLRGMIRAIDLRPLGAIIVGVVAGLVLNPYFPANLSFYYDQIVQIAVLGHGSQIAVGAEWYPYPHGLLYIEANIVFLMFALAVLIVGIGALHSDTLRTDVPIKKRRQVFIISSFILAVAFMLLTMRSRRHIEYFVPFAMLFDAAILDTLIRRLSIRHFSEAVSETLGNRRYSGLLACAACAAVLIMIGQSIVGTAQNYRKGIAWDAYRGAAKWLAAHTMADDVIVHGRWDTFPMLWYWNDKDRYTIGLDPTFMYLKDPDTYERWFSLAKGKTVDVAESMKTFSSKYLLIEKNAGEDDLYRAAGSDPDLVQVYEDHDAWIYSRL